MHLNGARDNLYQKIAQNLNFFSLRSISINTVFREDTVLILQCKRFQTKRTGAHNLHK